MTAPASSTSEPARTVLNDHIPPPTRIVPAAQLDPANLTAEAAVAYHASDCPVHNAPAYPPGPCNCGAGQPILGPRIIESTEEGSARRKYYEVFGLGVTWYGKFYDRSQAEARLAVAKAECVVKAAPSTAVPAASVPVRTDIEALAQQLCYAIEALPASEQQTALSIQASTLSSAIRQQSPVDKLASDIQKVAQAGGPIPVSKPIRVNRNPLRLCFFKDRKGMMRWRMVRSGRVVAASGEGYTSAGKAKQTLMRLMATISVESYVWDNEAGKPKRKGH